MSDTVPPETMAAAAFLGKLVTDNGYLAPRLLDPTRYAAIRPLMFTFAIIEGRVGDEYGYENQWCYHDMGAALAALDAWDGKGEPTGWHRAPLTGRRVSAGSGTVDQDGEPVPAGMEYVRL